MSNIKFSSLLTASYLSGSDYIAIVRSGSSTQSNTGADPNNYIVQAQYFTASWARNSITSSNAQTASYFKFTDINASNALLVGSLKIQGSFSGSTMTGSNMTMSGYISASSVTANIVTANNFYGTASYASQGLSSSYAKTASYALFSPSTTTTVSSASIYYYQPYKLTDFFTSQILATSLDGNFTFMPDTTATASIILVGAGGDGGAGAFYGIGGVGGPGAGGGGGGAGLIMFDYIVYSGSSYAVKVGLSGSNVIGRTSIWSASISASGGQNGGYLVGNGHYTLNAAAGGSGGLKSNVSGNPNAYLVTSSIGMAGDSGTNGYYTFGCNGRGYGMGGNGGQGGAGWVLKFYKSRYSRFSNPTSDNPFPTISSSRLGGGVDIEDCTNLYGTGPKSGSSQLITASMTNLTEYNLYLGTGAGGCAGYNSTNSGSGAAGGIIIIF